MPAVPADIAKYTTDGVVITTDNAAGAAILAAHPKARKIEAGNEIEMFFVDAAHALIMLNEKWALLDNGGPLHDGIEVEESLDLGNTIPIHPVVPSFTVVDQDERTIVCRTRGYARQMATDRYAVEVLE